MQIALVGFVLARLGLGVEAGAATWLLIARGRGDDGAVGRPLFVRWARILAGSDAGVVSARAYRLLFWLGLLLCAVVGARPGAGHPDAVRDRVRDRLYPAPRP